MRKGIFLFDHLPPAEAVVAAWVTPGPRPDFHADHQDAVRRHMPVLARAIERLVAEQGSAETRLLRYLALDGYLPDKWDRDLAADEEALMREMWKLEGG